MIYIIIKIFNKNLVVFIYVNKINWEHLNFLSLQNSPTESNA